jgi:hypothetical protein
METYRVTGPFRVAGTDPGGTVELDPERVNIPALIESGAVEPVKVKAAKPVADKPAGGDK